MDSFVFVEALRARLDCCGGRSRVSAEVEGEPEGLNDDEEAKLMVDEELEMPNSFGSKETEVVEPYPTNTGAPKGKQVHTRR